MTSILLSSPNIDPNIKLMFYDISKNGSAIYYTQNEEIVLTSNLLYNTNKTLEVLLSSDKVDIDIIVNSLLIDKTDDYFKSTTEEKTALGISLMKSSDKKILQLLLSRPKININQNLIRFIYKENYKLSKIQCIYQEKNLLHMAIDERNVKLVTDLLNRPNININIPRITTLMVKYSDHQKTKNDEKTPLQIAKKNSIYDAKQKEILDLLMNKNIQIQYPEKT